MKEPLKLREQFRLNFLNRFGWKTNKKFVVIDSDDWGTVRMPSRMSYEKLLRYGLNLNGGDGLRYSLYDNLTSSEDYNRLFDVLKSVKDSVGNHPVFTANSVVANPDFKLILENNFQNYFYEPITETLKRYGLEKSWDTMKEGIVERVYLPQFHGREHLNVSLWMDALRRRDEETLIAFKEGVWAFIPKLFANKSMEYEAAFQIYKDNDLDLHSSIITDGLALFEKLYGYKAEYFVPPNGRINNKLNAVCKLHGIKYRTVSQFQTEPLHGMRTKRRFHWTGEKEINGIRYIIRNCRFEPNQPGKNWVDSCLSEIQIAFKFGKPAVIGSHRVNYVGSHDSRNRDESLTSLKVLLSKIVKNYPDVEFVSSNVLGKIMDYN